jgi:hypothetical protein
MATDTQIQKFVQRHHGFIPKTGWITHVKEVHGIATLRVRTGPGAIATSRRARPKSGRPSKRLSGISGCSDGGGSRLHEPGPFAPRR